MSRWSAVVLVAGMLGCSSYAEAPSGEASGAAKNVASADPNANAGCTTDGSYRFCDDFDTRATIDEKSWQVVSQNGTLTVDADQPRSGTSSVLSVLPPQTVDPAATSAPQAVLWKQFVLTGAKARVELDLRLDVDLAKIQSDTNLVSISLLSDDSASILVGDGKVWVSVGGKSAFFKRAIPLEPFPMGQWTHVVLEVVFDEKASTGSVFVSSDGKVLADTKLQTATADSKLDAFWFGGGVNGWPETDVRLKLDDIKVY
jgi:hypothetical protein